MPPLASPGVYHGGAIGPSGKVEATPGTSTLGLTVTGVGIQRPCYCPAGTAATRKPVLKALKSGSRMKRRADRQHAPGL